MKRDYEEKMQESVTIQEFTEILNEEGFPVWKMLVDNISPIPQKELAEGQKGL